MRRALFRAFALAFALAATQPASAAPDFPATLQAQIDAAKGNMMADQAQALRHVGLIDSLARRLPDQRQRVLALATARWLGAEAYLRSNATERARPLLAEGLRLIGGIAEPTKLRGDLLLSQGTLYMQENDAVQALANYQESFRVFAAVKEPRSQAIALQNIGALYSLASDDNRAQQYYLQASELYDDDPALSLSLHNRRANILALPQEGSVEAEKEYEAALAIARQLEMPLLEARILTNLARNQIKLKQLDAADRTLARGFKLVSDADADLLRRQLLATAAGLAAARGDRAKAARLIEECFKGVDLTATTGEYRTSHTYAYEIFRDNGAPRLALAHLEAMKRLDEETTKVATSTGAALMAARFNYAEQQTRIQTLKAEEARRTAAFQRTLFLSIGGATIVIIILLSFGLVTIRRSRNQVRAANVVLGETNVALEKALKAKTEFLATTSHEIRTPLNGILGMTQVMLADPKLEAEMRDRIGIVHGAGVTMRSLVDDILDVAKMETGNLTVDAAPLDLCATLREVTRLWEEQARAKGLGFRLELSHAPGWIVSDAGRLRQIVFNLLSNAIKFTARGGVSLRAVAEGEGTARRLRLVVSDTGIGIPAEKFEEIFESFRQVDAGTTRQFGGTGLGLTICRNLARALGGEIGVESVEGEGAVFTVELPLVDAEAPAEAVSGSAPGAEAAMLVVDRNPIARSMLRTLLEPRAASLRFAAGSDEALTMIAEAPVTHILIDEATLKAGEGDVLETLQALVETAGATVSAVLWMKPDAETLSQLRETGIGHIIEKPVSGAALVQTFVTLAEENSGPSGRDPLESQAA